MDREFASVLGVSSRTVVKHVENAPRKLAVPNRLAAVHLTSQGAVSEPN